MRKNDFFTRVSLQISQQLPLLVFRHPKSDTVQAVLQTDNQIYTTDDFTQLGVVFAPFDTKQHTTYIIPFERAECLYHKISQPIKTSFSVKSIHANRKSYIDMVSNAQEQIAQGNFDKVVLSHHMDILFDKIDAVSLFENLLADYDDAMVYLWYHPNTGIWLGASPEQFFKYQPPYFQTTSLAGTRPQEENIPKWQPKEIEEHLIVTDYITKQLSPYSSSLETSKRSSIRAGALWHLKVDISGDLLPHWTLKDIITALHPTPAVCGFPVMEAAEFIKTYENYQRTYYTGFFGVINQKTINLHVNIRCIHLDKNKGKLFVGAGITASSKVDSEWQETLNKAQTIIGSFS